MLVHPDMELARLLAEERGRVGRPRSRVGWWRLRWWREADRGVRPAMPVSIEVRAACGRDLAALERLAALDGHAPLTGESILVAEVGGALWAAPAVDSGQSVADPFVPSAAAVEMLRLRARQLRDTRPVASGRAGPGRGRASATVGV